jgi:hypothetical protein
MIIDTSEWNEYIADDVPPGPIPEGIPIEIMQIVEGISYKDSQKDNFPSGLRCDPPSVKTRLFWRVMK